MADIFCHYGGRVLAGGKWGCAREGSKHPTMCSPAQQSVIWLKMSTGSKLRSPALTHGGQLLSKHPGEGNNEFNQYNSAIIYSATWSHCWRLVQCSLVAVHSGKDLC